MPIIAQQFNPNMPPVPAAPNLDPAALAAQEAARQSELIQNEAKINEILDAMDPEDRALYQYEDSIYKTSDKKGRHLRKGMDATEALGWLEEAVVYYPTLMEGYANRFKIENNDFDDFDDHLAKAKKHSGIDYEKLSPEAQFDFVSNWYTDRYKNRKDETGKPDNKFMDKPTRETAVAEPGPSQKIKEILSKDERKTFKQLRKANPAFKERFKAMSMAERSEWVQDWAHIERGEWTKADHEAEEKVRDTLDTLPKKDRKVVKTAIKAMDGTNGDLAFDYLTPRQRLNTVQELVRDSQEKRFDTFVAERPDFAVKIGELPDDEYDKWFEEWLKVDAGEVTPDDRQEVIDRRKSLINDEKVAVRLEHRIRKLKNSTNTLGYDEMTPDQLDDWVTEQLDHVRKLGIRRLGRLMIKGTKKV